MAYVEKYFIDYCDVYNTTRRVSILKKDYIGSATEILADVDPIIISYESSDDFMFSPIRPSVATVNMIFDSESALNFEEFWTADEKEYKVEDIKDGTVEWSGFVIPNGFQYEFKGGLYHASIEASDGLGTLESHIFVDDNQKPYGNQDLVYNDEFEFPFSLIITEILKKLELDLDLWTCVDNYEFAMQPKTGDVREADPLSASYVNVKTYIKDSENEKIPYWYGSGEEWNCKEVLENILYIFGAKLYQEVGVWRIKTINADIDYGTGATQRYWRKYNTAGTYLFDYEIVDDEVNVPCNSIETLMVGNDHVMSMDDVYKSFRINYEYQVLREGDTPLNLLPNGDFCNFTNFSTLAAPDGWYRWKYNSNALYIRLSEITIPFADAGGHTCGIQMGKQKSTGFPIIPTTGTTSSYVTDASLQTSVLQYVENNSLITLDMWCKFKAKISNRLFAPMLRIVFYTVGGQKYYLRNNVVSGIYKYTWHNTNDDFNFDASGKPIKDYLNTYFCYFESDKSVNKPTQTVDNWHQFSFELDSIPDAGWIEFNIHGLGSTSGAIDTTVTYPYFRAWNLNGQNWELNNKWRCIIDNIETAGEPAYPYLKLTGFVLGVIRDENEIPKQQDFIYYNTNTNYSLQVDPITVYNGDLQDENHISNIKVYNRIYTGALGSDKHFWDDLGDNYGSSSLGLLVTRQIMRQYQKPYRILEGNIKIEDARFGSVYTFSVIPGIRFILQRGSFNKWKGYIENATFRQLSSDVLPDGGSEGGNTLLPDWQPTGNTYCRTVNFLNDGYVIIEEQDVNPNSESYQETREVVGSIDTAQCPVNQPYLYYWGHDDVYLNTATLNYFPFIQISNKEIQVSFDNIDNNYLYFVHLKSLGSVEEITTLTTPNNVLSDWVYTLDVIINGYIYRVLRTDYVMTEFTSFEHNFKFA